MNLSNNAVFTLAVVALWILCIFSWNFDLFLQHARADGAGVAFKRFLLVGIGGGLLMVLLAVLVEQVQVVR